MSLIANYSNQFGKSWLRKTSIISQPQRIAIIKDGKIHSQRCIACGSFEWKNKSIQPRMDGKIQHRKGCKYA